MWHLLWAISQMASLYSAEFIRSVLQEMPLDLQDVTAVSSWMQP